MRNRFQSEKPDLRSERPTNSPKVWMALRLRQVYVRTAAFCMPPPWQVYSGSGQHSASLAA